MRRPSHVTHGLLHRYGCKNPEDLREFTGRRGDRMLGCRTCGAAVPALLGREHIQQTAAPPPGAPLTSRYGLVCVRCEAVIPVTRARPRIPICDTCKAPRPRDTQENE